MWLHPSLWLLSEVICDLASEINFIQGADFHRCLAGLSLGAVTYNTCYE